MVSSGVNFGLAGPGEAGQHLQRGEAAQPDGGAIGRSWATQPIGTIGCPTGTKGGAGAGEAGQHLQQDNAVESERANGGSWATQPIGTIGCPTGTKGVDLAEEISELKRERNAVILGHNYQG